MRIKINVCLIAFLCIFISSYHCSYSQDIKQGKVNLNKEFNQLQNTKTNNVEAFIQTSKKLNSDPYIEYINDKFTFDVKDESLEAIIKTICKLSKINYDFPTDGLWGFVSLKVKDMPLNEIINNIFASSNYIYELKNNALIVKDKNKIEADASMNSTQENSSDGSVKEVKLKYITTKEALSTLDKIFPSQNSSSSYSSYSSYSNKDESQKIKISGSDQTNSIILVGEKSYISQATEVVNKIDQEPTKIMIQSVMTTLDSQASKQIGAALSSFKTGTINSFSYDPLASDGLTKLTYGVLQGDRFPTKFSVLLDDLVSSSKAKIIAKPYTVVKSGKIAKVSVGNTSYIILTSQGAYSSTQNLERVQTGTNMEITPTLLDKDLVSMDILISDSYLSGSPDAAIAFYTNTSTATTNITVKNGETIVIGGLNNRSEGTSRRGFPFLSFIPFLGYKTNDKSEKEVVFFITPYILNKSIPESL